jgi:hypothetical protein
VAPETIAVGLTPPERVLLFCTQYARIGIIHATVQQMVVRSFVERDAAGRLTLTDQGRAVRLMRSSGCVGDGFD